MRRVLSVTAAALLGAAIWVAAPALSLRPYVPRAVDFELAVPVAGKAAAHASVRWIVTPRLRAPRRFDLLGARWRDPAEGVRVQLRVRHAGGRWSRWVEAPSAGDHGPDRGPTLAGTDPVWAGDSDAFQLRLSRPVAGLRVHFVNSTGTADPGARILTGLRRAVHAAVVALAPALARAQGTRPPIIPRADWGADQCQPRVPPQYGQVKLAFVHHTVSANDYAPQESAAIVLAICRYHRNSNGWNDIGYNFLVDKYGQIFEGRAGGVDLPVLGAQAQGYNSVSTGVAALGTYSDEPLTSNGMSALAKLIAWKLTLHGVPTQGKVTVISNGGSLNAHPAGEAVVFERIAGHRDGDKTECPGNALYAQLPQLRTMAAGLAGPIGGLTLTGRHTRRYPAPAVLFGRAQASDGSALAGAPLEVQVRQPGGWATVATTATGADGAWATSLDFGANAIFRVYFAGDATHPPTISPPLATTVLPQLRATVGAASLRVGDRLTVTAMIGPPKRRLVLLVQRRVKHSYRSLPPRHLTTSAGAFRTRVRLVRLGTYRVRVAFGGDRANPPARTAWFYVRTTRGSAGASAP